MNPTSLQLSRRSVLIALGAGTVLAVSPSLALASPNDGLTLKALPSHTDLLTPEGALVTVPSLLGFRVLAETQTSAFDVDVTFDPNVYRLSPRAWAVDHNGRTFDVTARQASAGIVKVNIGPLTPGASMVVLLGGLRDRSTLSSADFRQSTYETAGATRARLAAVKPPTRRACIANLSAAWTAGRPGELRSVSAIFLTAGAASTIPVNTRVAIEFDARSLGPLRVLSGPFRLVEQRRRGSMWRQEVVLTREVAPGATVRLGCHCAHRERTQNNLEPTVISLQVPTGSPTLAGANVIIDRGVYPEH